MCCDQKKTGPTTFPARVIDQLVGNRFLVSVPGIGTVQATARNGSLRPTMGVTAVKVGDTWRIV